MAYEILENDNEIIRVRISGVMRLADQKELQKVAGDLIDRGVKPRLLVMAENFEGWEKGEEWGDVGFLTGYGDSIVKMAIVGDERWKEQVLMFTGKGLRATEVEFFPTSSLKEAERWVRA
ncbi:MAG: STAS/SEC14 domain-containing protein [Methylobacter sp.]|nr:STAS/SEC14 domain-containing protein [Methylobacter sp.]